MKTKVSQIPTTFGRSSEIELVLRKKTSSSMVSCWPLLNERMVSGRSVNTSFCFMIVTRLAELEELSSIEKGRVRCFFLLRLMAGVGCCADAITDRILHRQFSDLSPKGSDQVTARLDGFVSWLWQVLMHRVVPGLPPNVENSGKVRSLESRLSSSGRLFCGVEQTGGVAVGLDPVPGTTTRNGLFPVVPNLPECRPSVAAGPISAVLPAGRLKWWWCGSC